MGEIMAHRRFVFSIIVAATVVALSSTSVAPIATAQPANTGDRAAFFFAYHPKPGMKHLFEEGYRRHLAWHRQKGDPLPWFAWYVTSGERLGLFIDASAGVPFSAFDQRVEVKADAADFVQTTAPFADDAFRSLYRLRSDLSTGQPIEDLRPSPIVQVTHYVLRPGTEIRFEGVIGRLAAALEEQQEAPVHTWYELVAGGDHPGFMLMVPRSGWADFGERGWTIAEILTRTYGSERAADLLATLADSVASSRSETWSYREDLSYFPEP